MDPLFLVTRLSHRCPADNIQFFHDTYMMNRPAKDSIKTSSRDDSHGALLLCRYISKAQLYMFFRVINTAIIAWRVVGIYSDREGPIFQLGGSRRRAHHNTSVFADILGVILFRRAPGHNRVSFPVVFLPSGPQLHMSTGSN